MTMVKKVSTRLFCLNILAYGLRSSGVLDLIKYSKVKLAIKAPVVEHISLIKMAFFRDIIEIWRRMLIVSRDAKK